LAIWGCRCPRLASRCLKVGGNSWLVEELMDDLMALPASLSGRLYQLRCTQNQRCFREPATERSTRYRLAWGHAGIAWIAVLGLDGGR
jgi:hypothetical protein